MKSQFSHFKGEDRVGTIRSRVTKCSSVGNIKSTVTRSTSKTWDLESELTGKGLESVRQEEKFLSRKKPEQVESSQKMETSRFLKNKVYSEEIVKNYNSGQSAFPRVFPLFFNFQRKFQNPKTQQMRNNAQPAPVLKMTKMDQQKNNCKYYLRDQLENDKEETYKSISSSEDNFSRPNLSSLEDWPISYFPENRANDTQSKMKRFVCQKLPFLVKKLQPGQVSKLLLILSEIAASSRVPRGTLKLDKREKAVLIQFMFSGFGQILSER